jgi:hypothetical protein
MEYKLDGDDKDVFTNLVLKSFKIPFTCDLLD